MSKLKLLGLMAALAVGIVYLWLADDEAFEGPNKRELEDNNYYQ